MSEKEKIWGVYYHDIYKPTLLREFSDYDDAYSDALEWSHNNEGDDGYYVDKISSQKDYQEMSVITFEELKRGTSKEYDLNKLYIWQRLINDRLKPFNWLSSKFTGTSVEVTKINNGDDLKKAIADFKVFVEELNKRNNMNVSVRS